MIQPAFEILNQRGTPMFFSDVYVNIPNAGIVGRIFIRTDSPYGIYRDTGSTWEQIAGSGGGGISGSGAAGQVTFWDGTSSVSGSNNLFFDNASGKFLVGTNNTAGAGKLQVTSATGDDQLRVWGATSPSIRIDNAVSGATQRFVMGLATATNNFIQGSAAGDICISTASANPLLFGMWQTSNASEVMRISTGNRLLIGTTIDAGYKVDISGTLRSTGNITVGLTPASQNLTIDTTSATQNILFYKLGQYSSYLWVDGAGLNHSSAAGGGTFLPFKGSSFSGTSCSLVAGNLNLLAGGSPNFIQFFATGVTQQGVIGYATGGTTMQFRTNGATNITNGTLAMSIFNSTNIGINTSTDAGYKTDINGSFRAVSIRSENSSQTISGSTAYQPNYFFGGASYTSGSTVTAIVSNWSQMNHTLNSVTLSNATAWTSYNVLTMNQSGGTITVTQPAYLNAVSSYNAQNFITGSINMTLSHLAGIVIKPVLANASGTLTVSNYFSALINDSTQSAAAFSPTNRWGIYQEGASDKNYFAANVLIGSTSNPGQKLYVNGAVRIDGQTAATAGGSAGLHLILNLDGTNYKIALLNV